MSNWLSRAKSLFHQPPPPPEPFAVECDCGGQVVGERTASYQKPVCSVCDRPVFVLPSNVYPYPKPKLNPRKPMSSGELKAKRPSTNTVTDENPSTPPPLTVPTNRSKSTAIRNVPPPQIAEPAVIREPRPPLITPLRLITLAIVLVSTLTGYGLWYRFQIENARSTVARANDAGMSALKERDFVKAAAELDQARRAVDILGRKDPTARDIRRFSREATALAQLAPNSLSEILQGTLSSSKPGQTEPLKMSSLDKDAWVIFDAAVISADGSSDRYVVDAPVMFREGTIRIEIESTLFRVVSQPVDSAEPTRFIFAAQLEQVTLQKDEPTTAVLTLSGKTAFLWSSYDSYSAIGYRPVDNEDERQTKALLERQLEASESLSTKSK